MFLPARVASLSSSRSRGRVAAVLLGALAPLAVLTGTAQATTPRPTPVTVPGVATTMAERIDVFYQQTNHRLQQRSGGTTGFDSSDDLGGVLTSGPAAINIGTEFDTTWVFARGADNAVWFRLFSSGRGEWSPWQSLGGRAAGAPGTTCTGDFRALPAVFVRGTDNALWRISVDTGGWRRVGGVLASDPGALPAIGGACPSREDVFVLGADLSVWEFAGGTFRRVGGRSTDAPTAVELPDGRTALFVRGTDSALWQNTRESATAPWAGWHRVGGVLTSAPVATSFPFSPRSYSVFAVGADGDLWRGRNVVGTSTWRWAEVP